MPHTIPEPNHAAASTRRTGTPSIEVISRSLASARIAVPTFVDAEVHRRPGGDAGSGTTAPMICVQLTRTSPTS